LTTLAYGGLDRTARALLKTFEAASLLRVPVHVKNVPGGGARKAWAYMDEHRGDPRVVSISHPNLTTDRLVGIVDFDHRAYTPIAMLTPSTSLISAPRRLPGSLALAPTWLEQGADCVIGAWRGIAGAAGIGESHVRFWQQTLQAAVATPTWQGELERNGWSACYTEGAALQRFLENERSEMAAALRELGLLRVPV
jgi:tripartite-type tricarboxylate transporter receptor subunit TctC